jgi:hypothetical protein
LTSDGWSDVNLAHIHNAIVCAPVPILVEIVRPDGSRDTSENLAAMILDMLRRIKREFVERELVPPGQVGICSDSPSKQGHA